VDARRSLTERGISVSYNDLLLSALGRALPEHPDLNASLSGETLHRHGRVHVGLAVDAPRGLLVPVIRDVDRKSLAELAGETASVVASARAGGLAPDRLSGGTFTLTNLGMYGIDAFTPVINYPQIAILGLGAVRREGVVDTDDRIVVRARMVLSLTFDHAAVDGAPAAAFLAGVAAALANPAAILLGD
jgi:pyruvate dehydrogenase E2 component (dihydrolipoamide acetyltransferase)